MVFQSEEDLCQSYRESHSETFTAEQTIGKRLVEEHAPKGLEGSLSLQADLVSEDVLSQDGATLVECKLEFEHRAVGQLLMYDWLLKYDAQIQGQSIHSIDRRLALGESPPDQIPTICQDLSIDPQIWASGGWQSISQGARKSEQKRHSDEQIVDSLAANAASSLDSQAENRVLESSVVDKLPGLQDKNLYREIPVGNNIFSGQDTAFVADAIGYSPQMEAFYLIEVKQRPNIDGLQKAIGQSVNYSSLFRYEWGLPHHTVVPVVLINQAPWITDVYRNTRYDSEEEMFKTGIARTDQPVILLNKVEFYQNA